ncbi:MAG: VCBS repeat-containing protein [Dokdonia sp.]
MIREDLEFNFLNYPYLYTGAGVAIGDIDQDGFEDVYLTSNFGQNKLYKNNGDFTFTDITTSSKTGDAQGFATGTTMMDVNNDGWLDIYVAKAGSMNSDEGRRNLLYVNQKDGTFKEEAKSWGIDDPGYSTQAYSLDYDKDGDLDLYVVNYRYDFKNNTRISGALQSQIEETTSDQLYRNDGTSFTKVTKEAGVYNKAWGLSGAVGDFNNDGWDDIYVSNDYLEPDILYINQKDGSFKDEVLDRMNHISFNSMGSDYADLNNDGYPDLITVDMLAENYARSKENMASMSTENFMKIVQVGYHHAYMANMLHTNVGNGKFKETAQLSGIVKTDWSWAPLIADYDNDGLKDIFITNGVYKDYNNQDFRNALKAKNAKGEAMTLQAVLDMMPSQKLDNYMYKNQGDFKFAKVIKDWGLEDPSFSNGGAYADFDNDGDLDLIVNNVNDGIGLYKNNSTANYLKINLEGPSTNLLGIGAEVYVQTDTHTQHQKFYLTRGFESSVSPNLFFGLGQDQNVTSIKVIWPDNKVSLLKDVSANQAVTVAYSDSEVMPGEDKNLKTNKTLLDNKALHLTYEHQENTFNDYDLQLLLPQKQSTKGTGITVADVNGDGLDDFFVGNAAGATAGLYIQNSDNTFKSTNKYLWRNEAPYEDANAHFFDADGDKDLDLYVVSAGYELAIDDPLLQDRLYINDGQGSFTKATKALPKMLTSGKAITTADYDQDGDLDIFVGGNVTPGRYPEAPRSYLLINEQGQFRDIAVEIEGLAEVGMVSEAIFTDADSDSDLDLMLVGEWMAPQFFSNVDGRLEKVSNTSGLDKTEGWWFSVTAADFDNDGDQDYILGNLGANNKFQPKKDKPIYINAKDFDDNGSFDVALSKINNGKRVPVRGKECSSEQNPFLLEKIGTYNQFAKLELKDIYGEDKLKGALQYVAHQFETIYIENLGDFNFSYSKLPMEAQTGPTLSLIAKDVNQDGFLDIIGAGAIYDAEVETIRYDSNYGYVLLGDGKGNFVNSVDYSPFLDSDVKDIASIKINEKTHYIAVSNNQALEVFTFD